MSAPPYPDCAIAYPAAVAAAPPTLAYEARAASTGRAGALRIGAILAVILIAAAALRFYQIGSASLWLDEFYSVDVGTGRGYWMNDLPNDALLRFSNAPAQGGFRDVIASLLHANHPPLYYLALHGWIDLFGNGDAATRSLSAVFSLLAIIFFFDAARVLHGRATGLWAAAIMAVASGQVWFSQDTRAYTMALACTMATCAALVRIEKLGVTRLRLAALIGGGLAMLLTHYLVIPVFAAIALYAAVRLRGRPRRLSLAAIGAVVALFLIVWGPALWMQRGHIGTKLAWQVSVDGPSDLRSTIVRACELPIRFFIRPMSHYVFATCMASAFYILPIFLIRRRPDLLLWWMLLTIGIGTMAVSDLRHGTDSLDYQRYALPEAAAVFALAAAVCAPMKFWRHAAPALLVLGCILSLPEVYTRIQFFKQDFRPYVAQVDAALPASTPILFIRNDFDDANDAPLCLSLRHYSDVDRRVLFVADPAGNPAVGPAVMRQLAGTPDIWFIASGSRAAIDPTTLIPGSRILSRVQFSPFAMGVHLALPQSFARAH